MAKLFHYSNSANLETLDPQQFGQNKSISPEYRQGTSHMVPRSYLYTQDKPEGVVANGRHRYEIDLPEDFKHYDLRQDPEGIIPATHKRTGLVGAGLSDEIEHEINRRGYHGYQPTDDVMISFRPIPVKKPNLFGKQEVSMSKNLKDKAIEVIKKAAAYLSANPDELAKAEQAVPGVVTPKTEAEEFPEHAAGIKNEEATSVEQKEMKKDEQAPGSKGKMEAALNAPPSKAAPGPKVNVPPKGSQIALKGKIKPESINKLKAAGYHPFFKDEMKEWASSKKECMEKAREEEGKSDVSKRLNRASRHSASPEMKDPLSDNAVAGAKVRAAGREQEKGAREGMPQKASDQVVNYNKETAKDIHRQTLKQLVSQSKPDLPGAPAKKEEFMMNDEAHAPGSPDDSAHDVVEEHSSLKEELAHLSPEGQAEMLRHLQTLSKPGSLRSLINRKIGKDAVRLYKGEHLLEQFADLSKAREDEGKSPESKAKNRSLRNSRNIEGKPKSESGRSLRSQSKIADRVSQVRFGAPSRPGEKVRGEPKKLEESHGVHVRQATYAPKERNKAGDKATGAMSEKGGQKSWRSGGQYHRRGGERQAHEDVMYGIKASKPNLPKAEMDSPPTANSQGFKNVDSGTMKKDEKKGYAIKKDGKPNFKLPMKDGKVDGSKIPKKNRAPGWNYAEGKEEVKKASDRNPDWQKEYKNKAVKSPKSRMVSGGEIARGVHGEHYKGRPGESTVGMQIRDKASMMLTPKERHQQKLSELKAMPKPNLPKAEMDEKAPQAPQKRDQGAEIRAKNRAKWAKRTARWDKWKAEQKKPKLDKAREDQIAPPEARGQYRQERRKFEPRDHMADDLTSEKGVSDTGIEIRRADKRNPGVLSHGYARVQEPEKHKQNAANRIRERLAMARMNRSK